MRFNKTTRIAAAVAVIGAVAAGGAAFTAGTGQPITQALGYGTTSVTGGTVTGISYQLSADGTDIDTVTLTTDEDLSTANENGATTTSSASVYLAFNNDGFGGADDTGDADCVIGGSGAQAGEVVTCTPYATTTVASVNSVQIAINNGPSNDDTFAPAS